MTEAWSERIRDCARRGQPLAITGGGSKRFYGREPEGELFDTRACAGVVDYEPTELVVVARAGTVLSELEATLAAERQMLAFEPPHFSAGATLGGAIASGLSGPRRPYAGAARDLVLGIRVIDGQGTPLSFGGKVMKNVAGFDVSRLMTGALGTLGVITEVAVKCLPVPAVEVTRVLACPSDESIQNVNAWGREALPLSATAYVDGRLHVRLSGAGAAVAAAAARVGGDVLQDAEAFWRSIRDHTHAFFAGDAPLWRLSMRSTAPMADLGGLQLIEWGGALRWLRPRAGATLDAARLRACAAQNGGHATLFRGGERAEVFAPLSPVALGLHQRIKASFDPARILNRGRMYASV